MTTIKPSVGRYTNMKFTITTSMFNSAQFIHRAYDSLRAQTYTNWEWIVTDDGSTDNSKQILLDICSKDKRVKYVHQSKKKEMFYNPQLFCKNADVIFQLDSDDALYPKALEVYHYFFTKYPGVVLMTCSASMIQKPGEDDEYVEDYFITDYRKEDNMTVGLPTYGRCWRQTLATQTIDFNKGDWMRYFYNDFSITSTLERYGMVLNIPRNLYKYAYDRHDSISMQAKSYPYVELEREALTYITKSSRRDFSLKTTHRTDVDDDHKFWVNIMNMEDTLVREFDDIIDECSCLISEELSAPTEKQVVCLMGDVIIPKKMKKLKDVFFDHDIRFNEISNDADFIFGFAQTNNDFEIVNNQLDNILASNATKIFVGNAGQPHIDKIHEALSSRNVTMKSLKPHLTGVNTIITVI